MFRISAIAAALDPNRSGELTAQIRGWLSAGIVPLSKDDRASAKAGSPVLVSRLTAVQIGLTVELVRLDVTPSSAAFAAGKFSHLASLDMTGGPPRPPGETFPNGTTSLIVWRAPDGALRSKVLNHGANDSLGWIRARLSSGSPVTGSVIIVDCATVLARLAPLFSTASPPAADE